MWGSLDNSRRKAIAAGICAVLTGLAAVGCGGSEAASEHTIYLVGYSSPSSVFEEVIEPAFQKTPQGRGVTFVNSFGPSADQARAVAAGQPASVVNLANVGDVEYLVEEGEIVSRLWHEDDGQKSAVAMTVRKGNPKGLKTLHDLLTKDVKVIIPNPFSSGAGRWALMAIYGSEIQEGKSPQEALGAVKAILEKTAAQPRSAADAMAAFLEGEGDVLVSYESDAIIAKREDRADLVVPPVTMLVEAPITVTKGASPVAEAFVKFIRTEEVQALWAAHGFRPIQTNNIGAGYTTRSAILSIYDFGGWEKVNPEFFGEKTGSITKIEEELGVTPSG